MNNDGDIVSVIEKIVKMDIEPPRESYDIELHVKSLAKMTGGSQNAVVAEKMMQVIPERYRQYDRDQQYIQWRGLILRKQICRNWPNILSKWQGRSWH